MARFLWGPSPQVGLSCAGGETPLGESYLNKIPDLDVGCREGVSRPGCFLVACRPHPGGSACLGSTQGTGEGLKKQPVSDLGRFQNDIFFLPKVHWKMQENCLLSSLLKHIFIFFDVLVFSIRKKNVQRFRKLAFLDKCSKKKQGFFENFGLLSLRSFDHPQNLKISPHRFEVGGGGRSPLRIGRRGPPLCFLYVPGQVC